MTARIKLLTVCAFALLLLGCHLREPHTDTVPIIDTPDGHWDKVLLAKVLKRDGTNVLGVYLGMIAERLPDGSVQMFSATSGELLKWIDYSNFNAIFVLKTKPEYPTKQ